MQIPIKTLLSQEISRGFVNPEKLEEKVERTVRELLAKANLVTREELTEVKDEIRHMRKTLAIEDTSTTGDDR